jgi:alkylhydroperoxidase family enzyme
VRLAAPRVAPLADAEIDAETRARLGGAGMLNIFRTLAHHPKLLKRWLVFGNHILGKNTLPERDRELLILRIGWLCRAEYEWTQHVAIAKGCGLSDDDIARIAAGPEAAGLDEFDRVQLRAVDELRRDAFLSDATWQALAERYDTQQILDLIFTVGQYQLVSMALNSLGVQLEAGLTRLPEGQRP